MADKEKKSMGQFFIDLVIVLAVLAAKGLLLDTVCTTLLRFAIPADSESAEIITLLLGYFVSSIICAVILGFVYYKKIENDGEERRLVLQHFSEVPCDNANIKAFIKNFKKIKSSAIVFTIALIVIISIDHFPYLYYIPIDVSIILAGYLIFTIGGRYRLYKIWDSERMHK